MAEVRKITIEIVEKISGGGGDGEETNKKKKKTEEEKKAEARQKAWKQIGKNAFETAKQVVISGVENSLNRYYSLTENYMAQTTYANAKKAISAGISLGSSLIGAAKVGMAAGPVGVGASVVIAGVAWGFSQWVSNQNRMSSYYQSLNASNYQSDFSQIRAGLIDGGRGTEN